MNNGNQNLATLFNQMSEAMEAYRKVQMDALKQCSQVQLDFMNLCMECNCKQLERLAKAETPSDIVNAESDVASEYMNKFFNNGQQMFAALSKLQDEMMTLIQDSNGGLLGLSSSPGRKTKTAQKAAQSSQQPSAEA